MSTTPELALKISILLPTRNRLDLLKHAVTTVQRQRDEDWELVISDNLSEQDIMGYVRSLEDERIHCVRTSQAVPVTDNWNNALAAASGEYVIMLGDDDALLPGYLAAIRRLANCFSNPDVIYHSALLYAYPSVLPDSPDGYLKPYGYASFFKGVESPFVLDRRTARSMVQGAMDFRALYGFNMQFATVSRRMIDELAKDGPFFRSPFPDYYAMNMLFLRAREIIVEPCPLVVIGVSPKSYGFFYANRREGEGRAMLAGTSTDPQPERPADEGLLPGSNINTGWLQAMNAICEAAGSSLAMSPNRRRYRTLQIAYVHQGYFLDDTISKDELDEARTYMSRLERLGYGLTGHLLRGLDRLLPDRLGRAMRDVIRRSQRQLPSWNPPNDPRHFENIVEVCESFKSEEGCGIGSSSDATTQDSIV
jgi:glycosyltransferase involved in cell wall biosynthesis